MLPLESFATNDCPIQFPVDSVGMSQQKTLCMTMTDPRGCPLDLSNADQAIVCAQPALSTPVDSSSLSSGSAGSEPSSSLQSESSMSSGSIEAPVAFPLPDGWTAEYLVREMYWSGMYLRKPAKVEDASRGLFSVTLAKDDFTKSPGSDQGDPGTYLTELVIRDNLGVRRISELRYLQVVPTLEWRSEGAITIPEIRMALMDYGCSNTLLDDVEFKDADIMGAIRRPIDRWNETTPNLLLYTPATFPWREHWMICTIGYLMRAAAHKYRRNDLTYQAAGLNISDMNKFTEYETIAKERIAEYDKWMLNKKVEMNVTMGVGSLGSAYGRYWYYSRQQSGNFG